MKYLYIVEHTIPNVIALPLVVLDLDLLVLGQLVKREG